MMWNWLSVFGQRLVPTPVGIVFIHLYDNAGIDVNVSSRVTSRYRVTKAHLLI